MDLTKSTKEVWDNLDKNFGASHLNTFKSLMQQLASIGSKVDDDDAIAVLLNSLPLSYTHIESNLYTQSDLTLENMIVTLLDEDRKSKSLKFICESAFYNCTQQQHHPHKSSTIDFVNIARRKGIFKEDVGKSILINNKEVKQILSKKRTLLRTNLNLNIYFEDLEVRKHARCQHSSDIYGPLSLEVKRVVGILEIPARHRG